DVISYVADRILVIYLGQIVEEGTASDIVARPAHPYTRALLTASSLPDPPDPLELAVDVRDASAVPTGCRLAPRCPLAEDRCSEPQHLVASDGRSARCWKAESALH
ncbi:MAG: oligopeptide ABC transporter ATP-binding protein, partial [bacterium]|nr:oligopeptide ABC transporter ATP-binding protein [bacterium]